MTIPRPFRGRFLAGWAGAALVATLLLSAPAAASDGYGQLWLGLGVANANGVTDHGQWGPGSQLGAQVGITDFWSIVGGVDASYHFAETGGEDAPDAPAAEVLGLFGGVRYNVDIFQYIPYVSLAVENFILAPPRRVGETTSAVAAKAALGVDWRYTRAWSVGGRVELHAPLADPAAFPTYSTVGVNLAYHFRL